jgi:hypothetical protein
MSGFIEAERTSWLSRLWLRADGDIHPELEEGRRAWIRYGYYVNSCIRVRAIKSYDGRNLLNRDVDIEFTRVEYAGGYRHNFSVIAIRTILVRTSLIEGDRATAATISRRNGSKDGTRIEVDRRRRPFQGVFDPLGIQVLLVVNGPAKSGL